MMHTALINSDDREGELLSLNDDDDNDDDDDDDCFSVGET